MPTHLIARLTALLFASVIAGHAADPAPNAPPAVRKAAIFVANRADKVLDDKLAAFEDFISSRITAKAFTVISHEVATDAVSSLSKDSKQTSMDQLLGNNASALRLGQMLGADYLILASLSSYGTEKRTFDADGVKTVIVMHNLRVTYKILEGVQGGTLAGDTVKVSRSIRYTENLRTENSDLINDLLDEASAKVAASVGVTPIATAPLAAKLVELSIACGMQDLAQLPVSAPDIRLTPDNTVVIERNKLEVQSLDVTVELDGSVIGSAPGAFKAPPGLHKLRLMREGFKEWERTINIVEGQKLKVALQMSDAGYQRWKDNTAFLNSLETGRKLTDAEVKKLEGQAQLLRQSGHKVDIKVETKSDAKVDNKSDIKVNTTEGLKVYKSIY